MFAGWHFQSLEGVIRPPQRLAFPIHVRMPGMIEGLGHHHHRRRARFHFNPHTLAREL